MKTKTFFTALVLFITSSFYFAQSDYERVQDYKAKHKQIEAAITYASSLEECEEIYNRINIFRNNFSSSKKLLDKALYPDDFESSIAKLENNIEVRKKDFVQIVDLTTQVETLQTHLQTLNLKNQELLDQIKLLNERTVKNEAEISRLNKLVVLLRSNIAERDYLVRDLVDSLLVVFVKSPSDMSASDKKIIMSKVKKSNLFGNVERTISDNIQFLKITMLTPQDFSAMKKQHTDFYKVWNQIAPKLSSVYLTKKRSKSEIVIIDSLFNEWDVQIKDKMWSSVHSIFKDKNINLLPFNDGDQFVSSVNSFIDNELKNIDIKSSDESKKMYSKFSDDVYFKTIHPEWIPVLIENKMLTNANQSSIESKINQWKDAVSSSTSPIVYIVLGLIVLGLVIFIIAGNKKRTVRIE